MAPLPAARARQHSYQLLGQIYLTGVTNEVLPLVQAVPELAQALPEPCDLDEAAATHYQLFGFNVFPYEAIFLDESGLLGGEVTVSVRHSYHHFGYVDEAAGHGPDHIGQELAAMAFLCLAEAEALARGAGKTAVSRQHQQITFLQHHLLRWLPAFVHAVKTQDDAFYTAVAKLTLAFIDDHYQSLLLATGQLPEKWAMPSSPCGLNDEETGLKDIAKFLTTPVYSGLFFSRDDVGRLARHLDLPRGFGDRQQLLTNLMRTAVQYDQFSTWLKVLETAAGDWQTAYQAQAAHKPWLLPFVQPWQERAAQTISHITYMQSELETDHEQHNRHDH